MCIRYRYEDMRDYEGIQDRDKSRVGRWGKCRDSMLESDYRDEDQDEGSMRY